MEGFPKSPETEDSVVLRDNLRERESSPEGPWGFSVGCRRYEYRRTSRFSTGGP